MNKICAELVSEIRRDRAQCATLQEEIEKLQAGVERGEGEAVKLSARVQKLVDQHALKSAERFLAGLPSEEPSTAERKRLQRLQTELEGATAAGPEARRRIEAANPRLAELTEALTTKIVNLKVELLRDACAEGRAVLGQMAEPLARMTASDIVLERLVGGREFELSTPTDPLTLLSGEWVAGRVLDLPEQLRPENFDREGHRGLAEKFAAETMSEIEGE